MDENNDELKTEAAEADAAMEEAPPPRPVRGLLWIVAPVLPGAAVGAAWSAYFAAAQRIDPMTPIWVGGAVGLGVGAFLWAFFPYKSSPRKRPNSPERDPS